MTQQPTNEQQAVKAYKDIRPDYEYDDSIFNAEPERIRLVKEILNTKLSATDRTIFILYCDCQSYRKLGKRFGMSHMTCRRECIRIKKIILEEYHKLCSTSI